MPKFYINSPFPSAIIRRTKEDQWLNANYYDDPILFETVKDFMIASLKKHIVLGLATSEVFILGKKNADFISRLNKEAKLFDQLTILEQRHGGSIGPNNPKLSICVFFESSILCGKLHT